MSNPRNPDQLIAAFLEDGPAELPDRSYDAVRAEIDHTRQWVVIGPWREQQMSRFAMFAAAAAVIVLVALVGLRFLPSTSGDGVGGQPTASPTSMPSPSASPSPRPTAAANPLPPLTEQYTSAMHGMTVSYPAGWTFQSATEPWTSAEVAELTQESAFADVIVEKQTDTPFIALASAPLDGKSAEQWTSDFLARREGCEPAQAHTVDGIEGVITKCGDRGNLGLHTVVVSEGRAFVVWLYRIDDMAYFEQILATVQLDPSAARTPAAGPLPPLTQQYTSAIHGMTVSYPAGWTVDPATEPWIAPSDGPGALTQLSLFADVIFEKQEDTPFIALASAPLDGNTADQWIDDFLARREGCEPAQAHTVDGIEGVITKCGDRGNLGLHTVVVSEGRAFVVWLYRIDDMAYFEQILATVQLDPSAAQ